MERTTSWEYDQVNILPRVRNIFRTAAVKYRLSRSDSVRVVIGAGGTRYPGWISTDYPVLDVTKEKSWTGVFGTMRVDAMLSEHVFEHLTKSQIHAAFANIYMLLKPGGYIRIAVPDGCHRDRNYIDMVKPGGSGDGSDDHKHLFDCTSLSTLLEKAGFTVQPLEWFDQEGIFHRNEWKGQDGYISRSSENDTRNIKKPLSYTSLIVDAYKQSRII